MLKTIGTVDSIDGLLKVRSHETGVEMFNLDYECVAVQLAATDALRLASLLIEAVGLTVRDLADMIDAGGKL